MKILLCAVALCFSLNAHAETLFTYSSSDLLPLQSLESNHVMSKLELQKWDYITAGELKRENIPTLEQMRVFTYLYAAQADAAAISQEKTGALKGSFAPISQKVLNLFLKTPYEENIPEDRFSEALALIVFDKVKERVDQENANSSEFVVPENQRSMFSVGLSVKHWIPWFIKNPNAFWPAPPPESKDPFWKEQAKLIKQAQNPMTEDKKSVTYQWAGMVKKGSDDWRNITNEYLFDHDVPLPKILKVRSVLMIALYDGTIVSFTAKYHYMRLRPKIIDPTVEYYIELPKHPTYPAGHAIEGTIASIVLSHFFPDQSERWKGMAKVEGLARVLAGVHYPIDIEAGKESGTKVANKVLEELTKN